MVIVRLYRFLYRLEKLILDILVERVERTVNDEVTWIGTDGDTLTFYTCREVIELDSNGRLRRLKL